jgi:hypothetical protein
MNHLPPVTAAATTNNPRPILTGRSMATPRPDYTPDGPGGHPRIRVGFELFTDVTAFLAMSGRLLDVGLNAEKNAEEPGRFSPLLSRRRLAHLTGMKWRIFSPRRPPRIHRTVHPNPSRQASGRTRLDSRDQARWLSHDRPEEGWKGPAVYPPGL